MFRICEKCRHANTAIARYCARCGHPVRAPRRSGGACRPDRRALILLIGAMVVAGALAYKLTARSQSGHVTRRFDLPRDKAEALYRLLAPQDIRVIVGREKRGAFVRGTPREVRAIERFVELMQRHAATGEYDRERRMARVRPTWTRRESYSLARDKARCLQRVLGFDDVPVLVWSEGRNVEVLATERDQYTVRAVVEILRGRR